MRAPRHLPFGAQYLVDGVLFQVWTETDEVELVREGSEEALGSFSLREDGVRELYVPGVKPGARYAYRLNGAGPFPDPASRFQPEGVHGWSEVVDAAFAWSDADFKAPKLRDCVFYELHVGCFTPEGTYRAATERLPYLQDLGINMVQLMPLAAVPGRWNWGYDGVGLFAPTANYGRPAELRAFVDRCHQLGLGVALDVVYNHLGPDGAYHRLFHPQFFNDAVKTPWGDGLNFDGEGAEIARRFFISNALYWLEEFHVDAFRLDATHAMVDHSPRHFLSELREAVAERAAELGRACLVIAEDERNWSRLLEPQQEGGYALDAVWADDFHHQIRRATAGDHHGYYQDFLGRPEDIAATLRQGWFYTGQFSAHRQAARGTSPQGLRPEQFVVCIQNHDQIGNRARGERLHHQVGLDVYLAATTLLLLAPQTPLLFMGQEWAATSPFLYFTDHEAALGRLVTEGRRREFAHFPEFQDEASRHRIPDPQAATTFEHSKLKWEDLGQAEHRVVWRWYKALLELRRELFQQEREFRVAAEQEHLHLAWQGPEDSIEAWIHLQAKPLPPRGTATKAQTLFERKGIRVDRQLGANVA